MPDPAPEPTSITWLRRNAQWLLLAGVVVAFALPRLSPFEGVNEYLNVFQRFSEWLLRRLESLFAEYGYLVVFLGVLLENSMFLGLLVPGSIILILGGLSAQNGSINIWYVIALAIAGTIIGDTLSYVVGRLGLTRRLADGSFGGAMEKAGSSMRSNHVWMILAYHWAGYSRVVGPAAAGLFGIPYRRWAPLDHAGAIVWVICYVMIGVVLGVFGVEFGDTNSMVRLLELMFTGLLVAAIVLTIVRSRRERRPEHAATAVMPVDE